MPYFMGKGQTKYEILNKDIIQEFCLRKVEFSKEKSGLLY